MIDKRMSDRTSSARADKYQVKEMTSYYMPPSPGDIVPRFKGRCGVQCFLCRKGKSMAPLCTKHLCEWDKLSRKLRVEIDEMCQGEPDPVLVKAASDAVKMELESLEIFHRVRCLNNIADSVAASRSKINHEIMKCVTAINRMPSDVRNLFKARIVS